MYFDKKQITVSKQLLGVPKIQSKTIRWKMVLEWKTTTLRNCLNGLIGFLIPDDYQSFRYIFKRQQ